MSNLSSEPLVSVIIPTFNRRDEVGECVESVLKSTYPRLEVVVVDNASSDGTAEALAKRFGDRIRVIASPVNLFAGGGRNLGARHAAGDYFLFVDSDNVVDPRMAEELIRGVTTTRDIPAGICGPFIYYHSMPDRLCGLEWDINMWTSRTWWKGVGVQDTGQFKDIPYLPVGHMPNVFMVDRQKFLEVGGIDPDYVIHYEESDFAEKIKRLGFRIVLFPKAKTWHRATWEKTRGDQHFAGMNQLRLYYSIRNRILFMRKNSRGMRLFVFLAIFAQFFLAYSLFMLMRNGRLDLLGLAIKAHLDGFRFKLKESA